MAGDVTPLLEGLSLHPLPWKLGIWWKEGSIRLNSSTGNILVNFFFLNALILGEFSHPQQWIIWSLLALISFISQGYLLHFPHIFLPFVTSALLPSRKQYIPEAAFPIESVQDYSALVLFISWQCSLKLSPYLSVIQPIFPKQELTLCQGNHALSAAVSVTQKFPPLSPSLLPQWCRKDMLSVQSYFLCKGIIGSWNGLGWKEP